MSSSGTCTNHDATTPRRCIDTGPTVPPILHNSSSFESQMERIPQTIPMNQYDAVAYQSTPYMGVMPPTGQEWRSTSGLVLALNTSMDQMAVLQLQTTKNHSPITPDNYISGRDLLHSSSDLADWQEKVRIEVSGRFYSSSFQTCLGHS